jgi:hypothetical protein
MRRDIRRDDELSTVNMIALMPLLKGAIDRHGAHVADLVERSHPSVLAWEASESAALGFTHIDDEPKNVENEFAAEQFEEAAMMYLTAAKMLRKGVGQ